MLIKPDLIVYMWLLPALLFFVFPFLCFPLVLLGERMFIAKTQTTGEKKTIKQPRRYATDDDKREYPREKIEGVIAQVSDGIRCCRGSITDISQLGVCFVSPSGRLDQNADSLGVLLTGAGQSFHMRVKPKWNEDRGGELSIGASIEDTLGSWDFLLGKSEKGQLVQAG